MAPTRIACLLTALVLSSSALAAEDEDTDGSTDSKSTGSDTSDEDTQETEVLDEIDRDDLEYQKVKSPLDKTVKGLKTRFSLDMEFHEINNMDFRALDESTDQAILDSDDRTSLAFTGVGLGLDYEVDEQLDISFAATHRGLWGTDQLGGTNAFGGWIYFTSLFMDYHPWGEDGVTFRVGRQPFELGGLAGTRDYVMADIVDMVRADIPLGDSAELTLIPIEVAASAPAADDITFVGYLAQSSRGVWNFRGKTNHYRHGAVFRLKPQSVPVRGVAYGYFTRVGAGGVSRGGRPGTGADISYQGELGNFADNDWIANGGLRVEGDVGPLGVYGQFEGSTGVDRKEKVAYDVDTTGAAWGAGVVLTPEDDHGLTGQLTYFESLGAAYEDDGMQYSHGFVGMKGRHVDGLIANRYLGLHPTAYLGWSGVEDMMHEPARKAGTRVIQGRIGYQGLGPVTVLFNGLFLQDTGFTRLDLDDLDVIDPPYGYSREEFAAQERVGKVIGVEGDIDVWIEASDKMRFNLSSGIFLPGGYYKTEVARVAGTQLGSADAPPAWVVNGGTHVRF